MAKRQMSSGVEQAGLAFRTERGVLARRVLPWLLFLSHWSESLLSRFGIRCLRDAVASRPGEAWGSYVVVPWTSWFFEGRQQLFSVTQTHASESMRVRRLVGTFLNLVQPTRGVSVCSRKEVRFRGSCWGGCMLPSTVS